MPRIDSQPVIAIYMATEADATDLRRLAILDSARVPEGRVLLAVVDGHARAAIGIDSGAVVADPFYPTADLVELLSLRAHRIRSSEELSGSLPTRFLGAMRRSNRRHIPASATSS